MSEKTQQIAAGRSFPSVFNAITSGVLSTLLAAIAAGCFLSVYLGIRSIQNGHVRETLSEIDRCLAVYASIVKPVWLNQFQDFYRHCQLFSCQVVVLENHHPISSVISNPFMALNPVDSHNPFQKAFSHLSALIKTQILPLLSGIGVVVCIRLWVFITAAPLFLLSLALGVVDGLVQRDIRKFQGARETSFLFHRIKRVGSTLFFLPLLAYLAWLTPISPPYFFLPMALLLGIWIALSVRFFKKYI